ncbi:MAG: MMPL family transporter [Planctomycetales bacterium]|nr:MMPL family transporter [Planctomycetales bacterium]
MVIPRTRRALDLEHDPHSDMLSNFYKKQSRVLLCLVALSTPFFFLQAQKLPNNNDIETWLPKESVVRATYERFKRDFGVEETILIGLENRELDDPLVDAVCGRLDRVHGIRKCWSPKRLIKIMREMGVPEEEATQRLRGLTLSDNGRMIGLIALLSDQGIKDRKGTVAAIYRELEYCQLRGHEVCIAGAPVVVTRLDKLGGQAENQKYFYLTLFFCLVLLHYWIRNWRLTLAILGLTVWAIHVTLTILYYFGGEMNFILGALSVMVMMFTLEASIHVVHYYASSLDKKDPLSEMLRLSWKPCAMSLITTAIGLFSVSVSNILPVNQFGYAAALGAVVAMLTGLVITPALLTIWPETCVAKECPAGFDFARVGRWFLGHSRWVVAGSAVVVMLSLWGVARLRSHINPLDFLPSKDRVLTDVRRVERELTNVNTIEAVIDFGEKDEPFVERLAKVRDLEQRIRAHRAVRHTLSLASFFPTEMPDNPLALARTLKKAESQYSDNEYLSDGERLWRISARIKSDAGMTHAQILDDLKAVTASAPIRFTGIAPLLEGAQREIFEGFWKSFSSALGVIMVVMILSLRSVRMACLAIIPNLAPIGIVFGLLGWLGIPVDIGMMMTGSIALGITVDGTYHFLVRYQEQCELRKNPQSAVLTALLSTGGPIFESIVVSSIGMLALGLSQFLPTAKFGLLMAVLLLTSLIGGLVLLPALLCVMPVRMKPRRVPMAAPHAAPEKSRHPTTLALDRVM